MSFVQKGGMKIYRRIKRLFWKEVNRCRREVCIKSKAVKNKSDFA